MTIALSTTQVLILSIFVLWIGGRVTHASTHLKRFSIPISVTGGVLFSLLVAALELFGDVVVEFDLGLRDTLLLMFFSTIGLSAKVGSLREGGRTLAILGVITLFFLIAQNMVGIGIATATGKHWAYGLVGGSISLAGGHGTAISWGAVVEAAGGPGITSLGMAFATFGLIAGGLVGGPTANWLIRRYKLHGPGIPIDTPPPAPPRDVPVSVTPNRVIRTIFFLAVCVGVGDTLNNVLLEREVVLPGFLTAMAIGIVLTNVADARKRPVDAQVVDLLGNICLPLFLAMSLMSMHLTDLAGSISHVAIVLVAQALVAVVFATQVVFRLCGRDYDAAIIAAGYAGLGLGATPVGVANMNAVTSRFGPSPKAFLVIPLVGAFLLDIVNAFVIQNYIRILG